MHICRYIYLRMTLRLLAAGSLPALFLGSTPATGQLLHPSDLLYEGVIAPPAISGGGPRFGYGMFGLAYDPTCAGREDPSPADGHPGCLVGTSHKEYDMIAMFDIPEPRHVAPGDYEAVPKGFLVVDFFKCSIRANGSDIQLELDSEPNWMARDIPGVTRSESGEWLCTCGHDWYDVAETDYDSHCWFDFDSQSVNAKGALGWGTPGDAEFHSQRMAWYLGSVPQSWADAHLQAGGQPYCFSGMQRGGGGCEVCSAGPTIYAFPCQPPSSDAGSPPPGEALQLLGYPRHYPIRTSDKPHPDFSARSQARGANWVGDSVLVSAYKGGDYWWYGKPDPWADPNAHRNTCYFNQGHPEACFIEYGPNLPPGTKDICRPWKGHHAMIDPDGSGGPQYTATLQIYDADELAQVAVNLRPPDSLLPYNTLENPPELWNSTCAEPGDLAFDPMRRKLYWVELNGEQPLIHVYSAREPRCCNDQFSLKMSTVGGGTVTSEPSGIDCGTDCQEVYLEGTEVALNPTPWTDGVFDGWGGGPFDDCRGGEVTMYASKSCTARFSCAGDTQLVVSNKSIGGSESFDHCNRVIVSSITVEGSGELNILAGKKVVFIPPFQIDKGAKLRVLTGSTP